MVEMKWPVTPHVHDAFDVNIRTYPVPSDCEIPRTIPRAAKWQLNQLRDSWLKSSQGFSKNGLMMAQSELYKFCKSLFSRSKRLTFYVLKYNNFKSVWVHSWTPLKILIFLHSSWDLCRSTLNTPLGKRRAIWHWIAVPKTRGKCESATIYRYITTIHWGWPASSVPSICWISLKPWDWNKSYNNVRIFFIFLLRILPCRQWLVSLDIIRCNRTGQW